MKKKIEYLIDVVGNKYLGLRFMSYEIALYIKKFEEYCLINDLDFQLFLDNQKTRDNNSYHCTFLPVYEYNKVEKFADELLGREVRLEFLGIGKAENEYNKTFFVVLHSPTLQAFRNKLGLGNKDLHITIGFNQKDVFNVSKGIDSLIDI